MTSAITLMAYIFLVVFAVAPALAKAQWTTRAPRLGIAAWHLLCGATVTAVLCASLMLSLNLPYVGATVASVVDLCTSTLQHIYGAPDRHTASVVALLALLAVPLRLGYVGVRLMLESRRQSRRLMGLISPIAKHVPGCHDALVIDHCERYAFCLPGRGGRLVITSALMADLSPGQLVAVLAHERAHRTQHHHLALLVPRVLGRTFGRRLPVFMMAETQVARLIELCADDAARRVAGRDALAQALMRVTRMPVNTPVLSASAVAVEERLARLSSHPGRVGAVRTALLSLGLAALALAPFLMALTPALGTAWHDLCIVG